MLTSKARSNGENILASDAKPKEIYECPLCSKIVTLKSGRIRIAHFAHKTGSTCKAASRESEEHYLAKLNVYEGLRKRAISAEIEKVVLSVEGDRRADVLALHPNRSRPFAFELQNTPLTIEEIERRTNAYAAQNLPVLWLPFLRAKHELRYISDSTLFHIEERQIPEWQRWLFDYQQKRIWFYDPEIGQLWRGWFTPTFSYRTPSEWHDSSGSEQFSSGGWSRRKSRMGVTLEGPFEISSVKFMMRRRLREQTRYYVFPNSQLLAVVAGTVWDDFSPTSIPVRQNGVSHKSWYSYRLEFRNSPAEVWKPAELGDRITS